MDLWEAPPLGLPQKERGGERYFHTIERRIPSKVRVPCTSRSKDEMLLSVTSSSAGQSRMEDGRFTRIG